MINRGSSFPDEEAVGNGNEVKFNGTGINADYGDDLRQSSLRRVDPRTPLLNLSIVRQKMDALQQFLSESVGKNTLIGKDRMDMVSTEISSAIHQIIVNGAALLAWSQCESVGSQAGEDRFPRNGKYPDQVYLGASTSSLMSGIVSDLPYPIAGIDSLTSVATSKAVESVDPTSCRRTCSAVENWEKSTVSSDYIDCSVSDAKASNQSYPRIPISYLDSNQPKDVADPKLEAEEEDMKVEINHVSESEIVELDAVELLAEHVHVCEICGKGFKRDANLRMHMRAHGDKFKTMEALSKPETSTRTRRRTRFSCPFVGCNRNKSHKKFRPLKSAICVKNHFKRSHCAKMFACDRCHKKSFSVVSDLKSHLKHCGESKWRCSCGTSFSRKDKLFGHMALFEGHMPAIAEEDAKPGALTMEKEEEEEQAKEKNETQMDGVPAANFSNHESYGSLFDILGAMVDDGSKDFLEYPSLDMMMDEFFEFQ